MTTNRKRHLKSEFALFQTSSILFNSISKLKFVTSWRNFRGLNPKGPDLSWEKEKENFCSLFTYSIKRAREIRKFQVSDLQRRLRNVQKSVMHLQSCCFANINRLFFCCSRCRCRRRRFCWSSPLLWSKNVATMVTWRQTSPLYKQASLI